MPTVIPAATDVPDPSSRSRGGLRRALPAVAVHTALRREFRLAGPLVRQVGPGDTRRAGLVAGHIELLLHGLDHHHRLEDEQVWSRLHDRVEPDEVQVIDTMELQHEGLQVLVDRVAGVLAIFRAGPSPSTRTRLADLLVELHDALGEHLDLEERDGLPLAEELLTDAEWRDIAERAEPSGALRERLLSFGMIQYEADPDVLRTMLQPAPLPVRVLLPPLARRAFRRHAVAVHGTPTP